MNQTTLSKRLHQVSQYIPLHARLADIGSDHAYLPVALLLANKIDYAVAGEVVAGPFKSAEKQVRANGLTEKIIVRLANGLDAINAADRINAITICGMGGALIRDILQRGLEKKQLTGKERLILQPNVGEEHVRIWLMENRYRIIAEDILEENEKIYEVIVAEKADTSCVYSEEELLFGPYLLRDKHPVFKKKWQQEVEQKERVLTQLQQSKSSTVEKQQQIQTLINRINEVLRS